MRKNLLTASLIAFVSGSVYAQTSPHNVGNAKENCRIALPYQVDEFAECSPQTSAAYDFAFCYVSYIVTSLSAPESDKLLGASSRSELFKKKGIIYANISVALSDRTTFDRNVGLTKKYYESLASDGSDLMGAKIKYVRTKCENIEGHHALVLEELAKKHNVYPTDGR